MGIGTLFTGPLSDAFGRKPVILGGAVIYILGAFLASIAQSLELVLLARVLQGLGAAGPRVAALAIIRDLYSGREMARVMSFAMMVFTLIPAVAPLIGQGIIALTGWRGIFAAFILFSLISASWLAIRQAETLDPARRRAFRLGTIASGLREVLGIRRVVLVILVLALVFGMMFACLSAAQQVFTVTFDREHSFPLWFGAIALLSGLGSLLNARIVMRLGMRRVVSITMIVQAVLSAAMAALSTGLVGGDVYFAAFLIWTLSIFTMATLTIGNLNALGMEPLGHLAGLGASVIGSIATIIGGSIAIPIGLAFDGTPLPLAAGTLVCAILALGVMRQLRDDPAAVTTP